MSPAHTITHDAPYGATISGFTPHTKTRIHIDDLEAIYPGLAAELREMEKISPVLPTPVFSEGFVPLGGSHQVNFINGTVGGFLEPDGYVGLMGFSVSARCPLGSCDGHSEEFMALPLAERVFLGCATAITEMSLKDIRPEHRYAFLPNFPKDQTAQGDVIVMEQATPTEVTVNDNLVIKKLGFAHAVVVSERWLRDQGDVRVSFSCNTADASMGVSSFVVPAGDHGPAEMFYIIFCTEQKNLGRREGVELARPLATGFEMIAEMRGFDTSHYRGMFVDTKIGISATLNHFAHEIRLPNLEYNGGPNPEAIAFAKTIGISYEDYVVRRAYTAQWLEENPDTSYDEADLDQFILPSAVMEWRYPGSLTGGFVYGFNSVTKELEQRTVKGCPGFFGTKDGKKDARCHLHYRGITRDTIEWQLAPFGVLVSFDESFAQDSSDPENNLPSNRLEQLGGIGRGEERPNDVTSRAVVAVVFSPVSVS